MQNNPGQPGRAQEVANQETEVDQFVRSRVQLSALLDTGRHVTHDRHWQNNSTPIHQQPRLHHVQNAGNSSFARTEEKNPNDQRDDELGSDHDPERAHAYVYSILGALQAQRPALDRSRPPPLHQQAAAANSDSDAVCYEREGTGANDLYADASTPAAASIVCESKLDQLGASAFQLRFPLWLPDWESKKRFTWVRP